MATKQSNSEEEMEWALLEGGVRLRATTSDRHWKIVHTQYAFCVLTRGAADWYYRRRSFTVLPRRLYVCEPGEIHGTYRTHGPGDYSVHFMDPEWMLGVSRELGVGAHPHFPAEGVDSPVLWNQMVELSSQSASESEEYCQRLSAILSSSILGHERAARPLLVNATLLRARTQLRERFFSAPSRTIRIRDVACDLGVGYHSLVHDFSRQFGAAPYEYVALLRRQYAMSLLRRGPNEHCRSLAAVRSAAGYCDAAHMSRDMRKHLGQAPRALARQLNQEWSRLS